MIKNSATDLLFIEPTQAPTAPIVDSITRKLTAAWRQRQTGPVRYRGQHSCTGVGCTATSDNADHRVVVELDTNSLCIHYVAMHRSEVPASELEKIAALQGEQEPTDAELRGDWRAAEVSEDEAEARWHQVKQLLDQRDQLLQHAYKDLPLDTAARYRVLRQAEDIAVEAGLPRPDYMFSMGVDRELHEREQR